MKKLPFDKYTLITNVQFVSCAPVRMHCSALLLGDTEGMFSSDGRAFHIRGFGTVPENEIFDIALPDLSYERCPWDSSRSAVIMGDDDEEPKPLAAGYDFVFKDGPTLRITVADQKSDLRLDCFEGDPSDDRPVLRVWEVLPLRVRQFWRAPYMPVGFHMEQVR